MAKKKGSKKKSNNRRRKEALKAQKRTMSRKSSPVEVATPKAQKKLDKYALPVKEIKKDLGKIVLFAALSITLLLILQNKGVSFTTLFPRQ